MAGSPLPSASVVICAHTERRWDDLLAALTGVAGQSTPPLETLVVVDHNPVLFERLIEHGVDAVVVENTERQGLGGARNTGVARARGDVVVFLDDDAVARPNWLEQLLEPYSDPDVLGVGGGADPVWDTHQPAWFPPEFGWVIGCSYTGMPTEQADVRNLIGCNMSIRRSVFDQVGGFTHELGRDGTSLISCEETELCIRAARHHRGGRFVFVPEALVDHRVTADRCTWQYFRRRCHDEGLSKAIVARHAGTGDGLASERVYSTRVLPRAVARGFADAVRRRDSSGLARSAAVIGGLATTTFGYARGRLRQLRAGS